jgi:hypothetical protein
MQWLISLSKTAKTKQNANENANEDCKPIGAQRFLAFVGKFESLPLRQNKNPETTTVSGFFVGIPRFFGHCLVHYVGQIYAGKDKMYNKMNTKCK